MPLRRWWISAVKLLCKFFVTKTYKKKKIIEENTKTKQKLIFLVTLLLQKLTNSVVVRFVL